MTSVVVRHQTATIPARFAQLADRLSVPDGGFSVTARTLADVKGGFSVAVFPGCERQIGGRVTADDVREYMLDHAAELLRDGVVAGGWRDPKTGVAYLDVARVVTTRAEAAALAAEHNQVAYFDFAAGRSVAV
jgi:hypothetical protein